MVLVECHDLAALDALAKALACALIGDLCGKDLWQNWPFNRKSALKSFSTLLLHLRVPSGRLRAA